MRRFLRFRLRTLLALMGLTAIGLSLWNARVQKREQAIAWIEAKGGEVWFEHQVAANGDRITFDREGRSMFWGGLRVHTILMHPLSDLERLAPLCEARRLSLQVDKTARFGPDPRQGGTPEFSLKRLADFTELEELDLEGHRVIDLSPIGRLANLRVLNLDRTAVTNLEPLRSLPRLSELSIYGTGVEDIRPLHDCPRLTTLTVGRAYLSNVEIDALTKASPGCWVKRPMKKASTNGW